MNERVTNLLNRFKNDCVMLDALYQWAITPTGVTAIRKGYKPSHKLIKENLKIRYNLTFEEIEKIFKRFIEGVESAGLDFANGFNEVEEEIKIYFDKDMVLKEATIQRLESASEEEKYIVWLWLFYEKNDNYHLPREKNDYHLMTGFQAILNAAFNIIFSSAEIFSILIKLGVINKLEWHASKGNKVADLFITPHYLRGCIQELEKVIHHPKLPDFVMYIDELHKKKRLNVLIGLETLLEKGSMGWMEGKEEMIGKILPFPYIIGKAENIFAINLKIYEAVNDYFFKKKDSETIQLENAVIKILKELYETYYPNVVFRNEGLIKGTKAWEIIINDKSLSDKDLFIIITPWVTGPQLEKLREKASNEYVMILTTMMGIPELDISYRKTFYKNMNENTNFNLMLIDLTKDKIIERVMNNKPKVYEELIARLNEGRLRLEKERKPENCKEKIFDDSKTIAFKFISNFERDFREFVINQLKNHYGQEWWEQGVTKDIKEKCQKRQGQDHKDKNPHSNIYDYMDYMDLYCLIEWKQNKDIFHSCFPQDLNRLKTRSSELYSIRNRIMHSRGNISDRDISLIKQYKEDIFQWIKEPCLN